MPDHHGHMTPVILRKYSTSRSSLHLHSNGERHLTYSQDPVTPHLKDPSFESVSDDDAIIPWHMRLIPFRKNSCMYTKYRGWVPRAILVHFKTITSPTQQAGHRDGRPPLVTGHGGNVTPSRGCSSEDSRPVSLHHICFQSAAGVTLGSPTHVILW